MTLRFGLWLPGQLVGSRKIGVPVGTKSSEIGGWIGKEFTGRGYAPRSSVALVHYAFDVLGRSSVYWRVKEVNLASQMAMDKIVGLTKEEDPLEAGYIRYSISRRSRPAYQPSTSLRA